MSSRSLEARLVIQGQDNTASAFKDIQNKIKQIALTASEVSRVSSAVAGGVEKQPDEGIGLF
jgi:hypothetical protein